MLSVAKEKISDFGFSNLRKVEDKEELAITK
jgi:hypothetical protein